MGPTIVLVMGQLAKAKKGQGKTGERLMSKYGSKSPTFEHKAESEEPEEKEEKEEK